MRAARAQLLHVVHWIHSSNIFAWMVCTLKMSLLELVHMEIKWHAPHTHSKVDALKFSEISCKARWLKVVRFRLQCVDWCTLREKNIVTRRIKLRIGNVRIENMIQEGGAPSFPMFAVSLKADTLKKCTFNASSPQATFDLFFPASSAQRQAVHLHSCQPLPIGAALATRSHRFGHFLGMALLQKCQKS